ncbi:MAG TPA: hypothetical protein PLL53_21525, partial [Saprospiraceae bacterium]|nr:hypothetical protein [Saprospiraceae bacterium]
MKKHVLLLWAMLFFAGYALVAQNDTILIDFGNNLSPAPWNNVTDPVAGSIPDLLNTQGQPSGRSILVYDP